MKILKEIRTINALRKENNTLRLLLREEIQINSVLDKELVKANKKIAELKSQLKETGEKNGK